MSSGKLADVNKVLIANGFPEVSGLVELLALLDRIADSGASCVLKIDGERPKSERYTLIISGGELKEDYIRNEGADLENGLINVVIRYFIRSKDCS